MLLVEMLLLISSFSNYKQSKFNFHESEVHNSPTSFRVCFPGHPEPTRALLWCWVLGRDGAAHPSWYVTGTKLLLITSVLGRFVWLLIEAGCEVWLLGAGRALGASLPWLGLPPHKQRGFEDHPRAS